MNKWELAKAESHLANVRMRLKERRAGQTNKAGMEIFCHRCQAVRPKGYEIFFFKQDNDGFWGGCIECVTPDELQKKAQSEREKEEYLMYRKGE